MWQNWQFFIVKFANFCGKIWQNLGFQMAIFCDASLTCMVSSCTTALILLMLRGPSPSIMTFFSVLPHRDRAGHQDFQLTRSHYADTYPASRELAPGAGIEPITSLLKVTHPITANENGPGNDFFTYQR